MDRAFLNWYTQSFGGIVGLIICMIAYLNGNMAVYGSILQRLDEIGLSGLVASFFLFPLCICVVILGALESTISNDKFSIFNKSLVWSTVIIGFLGGKMFFIIPSMFILFKFYSHYILKPQNEIVNVNSTTLENCKVKKVHTKKTPNSKAIQKKLRKTKIEIAIELLLKDADKNFIMEITNLTSKELESIERKLKQ